MSDNLFILDGPLCAEELPGARETSVCPKCGRGARNQVRSLDILLLCPVRHVWLTDTNTIVVDEMVVDALRQLGSTGILFKEVQALWRHDLPWATDRLPTLFQFQSRFGIDASSANFQLEPCECRMVRSISFSPLIVQRASTSGPWFLVQSPEVTVLTVAIADVLSSFDSDLELTRVEYEDNISAAVSRESSWSDL